MGIQNAKLCMDGRCPLYSNNRKHPEPISVFNDLREVRCSRYIGWEILYGVGLYLIDLFELYFYIFGHLDYFTGAVVLEVNAQKVVVKFPLSATN